MNGSRRSQASIDSPCLPISEPRPLNRAIADADVLDFLQPSSADLAFPTAHILLSVPPRSAKQQDTPSFRVGIGDLHPRTVHCGCRGDPTNSRQAALGTWEDRRGKQRERSRAGLLALERGEAEGEG